MVVEAADSFPSLRETLESAVDEHDTPAVGTVPEVVPDTPAVEATPEPEVETSGRQRNDKGQFIKNIDTMPEDPAPPAPQSIAPEPTEIVELAPPPLSWKKVHHEGWKGIDPTLQAYINQRETEYASGVSTYKNEYDRVKPLSDAIAPFMEELTANNLDPGQWISNLGNAHRQLAMGNPEQKLSMFMKLANDYQIPVQQLFQQGEDGKLYYNPQVQQYHPQPQQSDINALVENKIAEYTSLQAIQQFEAMHAHYETVRETMAQLLEAGLADDLPGAYDAALKHPRHSDLADSIAQQATDKAEADRQAKLKAETENAKANAVSVRTATPASSPTTGATKGVRNALESAWESHDAGRI